MNFQQCDLVFNDNAMTPEQNKILEMIPYITSYYDFIFQVTDSSANISAIAKPFQWTVGYNKCGIHIELYLLYMKSIILLCCF